MTYNYTVTPEALNSRIRATSKAKGLDPEKSAARYFGDRLVEHFAEGFGPLPFAVKGGMMWPQTVRETADIDLQVSRHYTQDEVLRAFGRLTPILAQEGIVIERLHPEREMFVGAPDPVCRHHINAVVGGIRVATDLDLSAPVGPYAWPYRTVEVHAPSFLPRTPQTTCRVHTFETSAAEKWWYQINQSFEDPRVKHMADLLYMSTMKLNSARVASELCRVALHNGHTAGSITRIPAPFGEKFIRRDKWEALSAERRMGLEYYRAHSVIFGWWQEIHHYVEALSASERRKADRVVISEKRHPGFHAKYGEYSGYTAENVVAFLPR